MLRQDVAGGSIITAEEEENFEFTEFEYDSVEKFNAVDFCGQFVTLLLNVRSLNAHHFHLQVYLKSIKVRPHVIVCTETWNLDYYEMFQLDGYKAFYNNSRVNLADGVVMYVRNDLNVIENKVMRFGDVTFLSTLIKLSKEKTLTCTGLYRCHDIPILAFNEAIKKFLNVSKSKNHKIFGDFNIDLLSNNSESNDFLFSMLEKGFLPFLIR